MFTPEVLLSIAAVLVAMLIPRLFPRYPRRYRACCRLFLMVLSCDIAYGVYVFTDWSGLALHLLDNGVCIGICILLVPYLLLDMLNDVTI